MSDIVKIKIKNIDIFKIHQFLVNNDETLTELDQNIKEKGLFNQLIINFTEL